MLKKTNKLSLTSLPACLGRAWLYSRTLSCTVYSTRAWSYLHPMASILFFFFFSKITYCEGFIDLVSLILLSSFGDYTVGMMRVNRQFGHS